jgi:high-affinity Fe2+/Pb2+ permease
MFEFRGPFEVSWALASIWFGMFLILCVMLLIIRRTVVVISSEVFFRFTFLILLCFKSSLRDVTSFIQRVCSFVSRY